MQLLSVNIGQKRTQQKGNEIETTGIYKLAVQEPVEIMSPGIQSDFICDQKNHGGPDQAIYIYGAPDYEWWSKELKRELTAGTFGDNLTVSELESASFNIGDRLHIGSTILEVERAAHSVFHAGGKNGRSTIRKEIPSSRAAGIILPRNTRRIRSNRR